MYVTFSNDSVQGVFVQFDNEKNLEGFNGMEKVVVLRTALASALCTVLDRKVRLSISTPDQKFVVVSISSLNKNNISVQTFVTKEKTLENYIENGKYSVEEHFRLGTLIYEGRTTDVVYTSRMKGGIGIDIGDMLSELNLVQCIAGVGVSLVDGTEEVFNYCGYYIIPRNEESSSALSIINTKMEVMTRPPSSVFVNFEEFSKIFSQNVNMVRSIPCIHLEN